MLLLKSLHLEPTLIRQNPLDFSEPSYAVFYPKRALGKGPTHHIDIGSLNH